MVFVGLIVLFHSIALTAIRTGLCWGGIMVCVLWRRHRAAMDMNWYIYNSIFLQ